MGEVKGFELGLEGFLPFKASSPGGGGGGEGGEAS